VTSFQLHGNTFYIISQNEKDYLERGQKKVNRKEVAKMWGISPNRLSECPWLVPDGEDQQGRRNAEWYYFDVMELVKKGKKKCKEEFDARHRH